MSPTRSVPELFNLSEAAAYLNTSVRHVRRLREERKLPAVKIGGKLRFDREGLDKFIADNTVEAVSR